ncbi:MAG: PAS domain S-box protein [Afipia sp.]|nr:PAS domain S-box protein [Afipia sp.]
MDMINRTETSPAGDGCYRLLVEAVGDYAIVMLDPQGRITTWNSGAERCTGYGAADIIGSPLSRLFSDDDVRDGLPARALEAATRAGKLESDGWRLRKDGSRFWAEATIDPIRDENGVLVGFAMLMRDLTERRAAEQRLRASEEQFRLLVQGVTDYALYMLNPEGRVSSWNAGAERIKQYAADEIIGRHFSTFYTAADRDKGEPQQALKIARREGRFEKESWRVRKDGTQFWAHVVIDPIYGDDGGIIGFAKITRDITERRQAQITLDQTREALAHSQKMDAIGQLSGGIAHDFNNLLMVILGSLELAGKRLPDDPRVSPLIANATQAAQRGAALTQRMLAFARHQDLNLRPVDVPVLVRGMTDLLQSSIGPSIRIETQFPLPLSPVHADANQLEMALLNLAVNARDAMPDGGSIIIAARDVTVAAGAMANLKAGNYVCLSVTDTGEGMDRATLLRAMEPFFTTKGVGRGTGLGLSMVHGMTEQSGGRFLLKSRKGRGTTAEMWLPVALAKAGRNAPAAGGAESAVSIRPLVVLAVDDDGLVLMNTAVMLQDLGHAVIEATSARQALDILRGKKPVDLVITDYAMPQMTGAQLAASIRTEWPDMPVILATGYAELPPGAETGLPKLAKPFRQVELMRAVAAAVPA